MSEDIFSSNLLLAAVEPSVRALARAKMQSVELRQDQVLYSLGDRLDYVYFPISGLIGILSETPDGETIDSALLGREGAVGAFEACGSRQFFAEAVVQVPGQAARIAAADYRDLFERSPGLRNAVHRYVEQLISETRQSVACNSIHDLEARLCRMMLDALDRSGLEDTLPLTQRTMARMLGAQRSTVTAILSRLVRDGIVTQRRGALVIEDRSRLEYSCCGCRGAVKMARAAIWAQPDPSCDAAIAAE